MVKGRKAKKPFGLEAKEDKSILPPDPKAPAADTPDWVGLIEKKDAEVEKKAKEQQKVMKAAHDKLLGLTGSKK